MRALTLDGPDSAPSLRDDLPAPTPAENEVLVRMHASSANPVDNSIAAGVLAQMGIEYDYPVTLGRDYAGVVEEVGGEVTRYAPGDEAFGFLVHANPAAHEGTWAELIAVPEDSSIGRVPTGVDLASAGAAPLAAIAATTSIDALDLSEGDVLLVAGAPGGVGSFAVQLAVEAGATVIAPGLPEDEDYLKDLGVSEILPREGDVAAAVRERLAEGIDAVLDLVNYEPGSFDGVLKEGARVASPTGAAGEGPGRTNVMAQPTTENLDRVGQLLGAGTLRVPVQESYGLDRAAEALRALSETHTQGKLAIGIS